MFTWQSFLLPPAAALLLNTGPFTKLVGPISDLDSKTWGHLIQVEKIAKLPFNAGIVKSPGLSVGG